MTRFYPSRRARRSTYSRFFVYLSHNSSSALAFLWNDYICHVLVLLSGIADLRPLENCFMRQPMYELHDNDRSAIYSLPMVMLAVVFAWLFWLGSHPGQNAGLSEVWMSMSVSIPQMMHTFRGWIKPKIVTLTLTQTDRIAWPRIWTSLQPSAILSLSKQM